MPVVTGVACRAELWNGGAKSADLALTSCQLTADATASVRHQVRLQAAGVQAISPVSFVGGVDQTYGNGRYGDGSYGGVSRTYLRGLLLPSVTDVRLFYSAGGTETPLGVLRASQVAWQHDSTGLTVDVTAYGIARRIQKAGWDRPFVIGGTGLTVADGIRAVVADRAPGTQVTISGCTDALPQKVLGAGHTNDPWADIVDLALLSGCEVYDDTNGGITVRPVLDLTGKTQADAAWTFTDGVNGTVMRFVDTQDDQELVNTVVVVGASNSEQIDTGTGTASQVIAIAQITDPASPWNVAAVGELTVTVEDSSFTSTAQCQNAANAHLRVKGGLAEQIEIDLLPNPLVRAGDLAWVSSSELGTDGLYQVVGVRFDAAPGTATTVTVSRMVGQ